MHIPRHGNTSLHTHNFFRAGDRAAGGGSAYLAGRRLSHRRRRCLRAARQPGARVSRYRRAGAGNILFCLDELAVPLRDVVCCPAITRCSRWSRCFGSAINLRAACACPGGIASGDRAGAPHGEGVAQPCRRVALRADRLFHAADGRSLPVLFAHARNPPRSRYCALDASSAISSSTTASSSRWTNWPTSATCRAAR